MCNGKSRQIVNTWISINLEKVMKGSARLRPSMTTGKGNTVCYFKPICKNTLVY